MFFFEKQLFFRADMAALGKNCRIGVYRVKALVLLYHIVSKPSFLNMRLTPHLVVEGYISFYFFIFLFYGSIAFNTVLPTCALR